MLFNSYIFSKAVAGRCLHIETLTGFVAMLLINVGLFLCLAEKKIMGDLELYADTRHYCTVLEEMRCGYS